jgi:hypothetical protein
MCILASSKNVAWIILLCSAVHCEPGLPLTQMPILLSSGMNNYISYHILNSEVKLLTSCQRHKQEDLWIVCLVRSCKTFRLFDPTDKPSTPGDQDMPIFPLIWLFGCSEHTSFFNSAVVQVARPHVPLHKHNFRMIRAKISLHQRSCSNDHGTHISSSA